MKRLLLPLAFALSLSGCNLAALTTPPATYANATVLDERIAISVELAYQAAAMAVIATNDVRPFSPELKARIKAADRKAYEAVTLVRAAYRAGNASGYSMAVAEAQNAIAVLIQLIGG